MVSCEKAHEIVTVAALDLRDGTNAALTYFVLISSKVKWLLSEKGIAANYSYKQVFHYLSKAKKVRCGTERTWTFSKTVKYISDLMKLLGV